MLSTTRVDYFLPQALQEMTHTCRDTNTRGSLIPQCLRSLWTQNWFTMWQMPLHTPETWPTSHPEQRVFSVGWAAHIAEWFEAWRPGLKRQRPLPSPFSHPRGCRLWRGSCPELQTQNWKLPPSTVLPQAVLLYCLMYGNQHPELTYLL